MNPAKDQSTSSPWTARRLPWRLSAGLLTSSIAVISPQPAQAQLICATTQVTDSIGGGPGGAAGSPSISADGTRIAFPYNGDLTDANPDGNFEIFLFDANSETFNQITHSTGGLNHAPSINADGTRVAFASNRDLTGDNPDGNAEIFLFDTGTGALAQLTQSTGNDSGGPSISADGTHIAFASNADLVGGNPDGNTEIFFLDTATSTLSQVTVSPEEIGNGGPSLSASGSRIAFESNADFTGDNPDGNSEIFLADADTQSGAQITESARENFLPSINGDGTRIAFASNDDYTGSNTDANFEIFLFDLVTGARRQVTDTTGDTFPVAAISTGGTRVAIQSTSDLTGGNADGNTEVFLFDTTMGTFSQVSHSTVGVSGAPSINAAGSRIAFVSDRDLTGGNPDGNREIFLAECLAAPVVIDGCDSGVPDVPLPGGGTITDRINQCAAGAKNHGAFVSCVSHLTNDLKKAGIITGAQKGAIQSCASKADIP